MKTYNMKYLIVLFLTIILAPLFGTNPAVARIDVDISTAELRKVPVAVPYFLNTGKPAQADKIGQEMADILARSLEFHGFISIIPASSYGGGQQNDWLRLQADYAVIGQYTGENDGTIIMEIRLLDIATGRLILGRRYQGTEEKTQMMLLKFCDDTIDKMTGEPGVSRTKIAYVSEKDGIKEIYMTDIFGTTPRQITKHRRIAVSPRFTPDGLFLSYTSYHRNNPTLYLTELAQSKVTVPLSQRKGLNMAPAWSPDGNSLAITLSIDGAPDLYLLDRQGEIISRLTKNEGINVSPSWSPDGKQLTFVSDRSGSPQVYVMDIKGKSVKRLTYVGNYNTTPAWSPKGDLIAYSGRYENKYHIFVIPAEGGRPTRLTRQWADHESPTWSPDGRQIAFSRNQGGKLNICAIFKNGAGLRVLFDWDGNESMPQWSPRPAD
jgi:TolB protein